MSNVHRDSLTVIYDGECPFCTSYVRLMALRKNVGQVRLIDARSDDPAVGAARAQGLDLNEGMVAVFGEKTYYGSDALALISTLSGDETIPKRVIARLFGNPKAAAFFYPAMKLGRRVTLRLLGRPLIGPPLASSPARSDQPRA